MFITNGQVQKFKRNNRPHSDGDMTSSLRFRLTGPQDACCGTFRDVGVAFQIMTKRVERPHGRVMYQVPSGAGSCSHRASPERCHHAVIISSKPISHFMITDGQLNMPMSSSRDPDVINSLHLPVEVMP
jgi:hypothetical protein